MNLLSRSVNTLKRLTVRWGTAATQFFTILGRGRPLNLNTYHASDEAVRNSAAVATVRWIQRNWSEAPIMVGKVDSQDIVKVINSRLLKLLKRPNSHYSGLAMFKGVVANYIYTGNAYLLKMRSTAEGGIDGRGRVDSLWWVPSFMIVPEGDPDDNTVFIKHYVYEVDGFKQEIDPRDIVHFRDGFDPKNPRYGISAFSSLLRELLGDNEAANWKLALLMNSGVPGIIISGTKDSSIALEDAEQIKEDYTQRFTGSNRGLPLIMSGAIDVQKLAFDPEQMNLTALRHSDEERITAAIGVPAVVVGLGAGLVHSTFANFSEAREAAYESCMIPMQDDFAETLTNQLLPELHNIDTHVIQYDISKVRVLQPDINALHVRVRGDVLTGIISVNEGRKQLGYPPVSDSDVWYVPNGVTVAQSPGTAIAPNNTGDNEDDIGGNPEGGAPTNDDPEAQNRSRKNGYVSQTDFIEALAKINPIPIGPGEYTNGA